MSRGVRRNCLVKASERQEKERLVLLGVKFAHTPEWGASDKRCIRRRPPRKTRLNGIQRSFRSPRRCHVQILDRLL
jgi:hypothetical protein